MALRGPVKAAVISDDGAATATNRQCLTPLRRLDREEATPLWQSTKNVGIAFRSHLCARTYNAVKGKGTHTKRECPMGSPSQQNLDPGRKWKIENWKNQKKLNIKK
jgi:hypothetical protein